MATGDRESAKRLIDSLDDADAEAVLAVLSDLAAVRAAGYGEVLVKVVKGRVRQVQRVTSRISSGFGEG